MIFLQVSFIFPPLILFIALSILLLDLIWKYSKLWAGLFQIILLLLLHGDLFVQLNPIIHIAELILWRRSLLFWKIAFHQDGVIIRDTEIAEILNSPPLFDLLLSKIEKTSRLLEPRDWIPILFLFFLDSLDNFMDIISDFSESDAVEIIDVFDDRNINQLHWHIFFAFSFPICQFFTPPTFLWCIPYNLNDTKNQKKLQPSISLND